MKCGCSVYFINAKCWVKSYLRPLYDIWICVFIARGVKIFFLKKLSGGQ